MKCSKSIWLVLACFCHSAFAETGLNCPDFVPPFELKQGERVDGEIRVTSFLDNASGNQARESATLVFGNKRVTVREEGENKMATGRDNVVNVLVNEDPIFSMVLVANFRSKDGKTVSLTDSKELEKVRLESDEASKTIRWSRGYQLPDGKETEFSYQLQSLGDSKIKFSWALGVTAEQIEELRKQGHEIGGSLLYFEVKGDYRAAGLKINGIAIEPKPVEILKQHEGEKLVLWDGMLKEMVFAPDKPLYGFELRSEDGLRGNCREIFQYGRIQLGFQLNGDKPKNELVIDFGKVTPPDKNAPAPIEGQDLWVQDALHLPHSPTRNLFPNPSFEQGLTYWRWFTGGATYTPSEVLHYAIDPVGGRFGKQAMVINPVQESSATLRSFSVPSEKGKTYSVSFYAKAENEGAKLSLAPYSSKSGGQFTRETVWRFEKETLGTEWKRYSYSFQSDGSPISFIIPSNSNHGKIWVDGIQVEAGEEVTDFVAPRLEGEFSTSHPQNNVEFGVPIDAKYAVRGEPGMEGKVSFELKDFYGNTIWSSQYKAKAGEVIALPFDEQKLGTGAYFLRSRFEVAGTDAFDFYYRFTIIDSLDGTHATKDLYGALVTARINRTEEELELMQRLGFVGSSSYGEGKLRDPLLYEIREKFNITDYTHTLMSMPHLTSEQYRDRDPDLLYIMSLGNRPWRTPEERNSIKLIESYSETDLKRMEELAEKSARACPYVRVWSLGTEEEISIEALKKNKDFKEYAKLQEAFYRGIKKGNPNAIVLPSGGTSGYGKTRGKDDIDGFLRETQGKVKWDAVAIHPYGSIDGTLGAGDLDESLEMLKDSMAQYGYGEETPILLNEGGGGSSNLWGDGPSYSYDGGQPSYDLGLHEFLNACKMARQYIICLKNWPQVQHFNTWQDDTRRIVDYNLTPSSFLLGINTLGHLLGEPKFLGDVRPAQGVRGYAFEDKKNGGVAAMWCTIDDVERGFVRGPVMRVHFDGELPKIIDLMGNVRPLKAAADGLVDIQLTPAPLFFKGKDAQALAKALQKAEVLGTGANVEISFQPTLGKEITGQVKNMTSREQQGSLEIDGKAVPFRVAGSQEKTVKVAESPAPEPGKMFSWNKDYLLKQQGIDAVAKQWKMDYFHVPKVEGEPDWSKVPAIAITNISRPVINQKQTPSSGEGDLSATFQAAWNGENFYLRVEAEDDHFDPGEKKFWNSPVAQTTGLNLLDGGLEVYLDCGKNGRLGSQGFDLDDYRYDFSVGNAEGRSGSGKVARLQEVFNEYAGGTDFPTKEEAAKSIRCEFTRISETRYAYTITFAQRYIAPFRLEAGNMAGFGLYLHDRMDDGTMGNKGLSLATEPGAPCDRNPGLWPLMILSE